jgi:predicted HAD superfamily Cof-like phosphohydrolase
LLQSNYDKVLEFHRIFGHPINQTRGFFHKDLRYKLIAEELQELDDAIADSNLVEIADALGDIVYVVYGAAITFGLDLDNPPYPVDDEFLGQAHSSYNLLLSDFGSSLAIELKKGLDKEDLYDVEVILGTILSSAIGAADVLGLPLDEIVTAIHRSNLTKLGADGRPIYNDYNKVVKGPNYLPPTEDIKRLLGV